jgi:hypothetical protein
VPGPIHPQICLRFARAPERASLWAKGEAFGRDVGHGQAGRRKSAILPACCRSSRFEIVRAGANASEIRGDYGTVRPGSVVARGPGVLAVGSSRQEGQHCRDELRAEQAWQLSSPGHAWLSRWRGATNCGVRNTSHRARKVLVPARCSRGKKALSRGIASGREERVAEVGCSVESYRKPQR